MTNVVYFLPAFDDLSELADYIESREKLNPILEPVYDRCINCEATKRIVSLATLGPKWGSLCNDCYSVYRNFKKI